MTLENLLSQVGIGTKQLTDRYSGEYGAPVQDQHVYYAYEHSQPTHTHTASSKHHHYSSGSGLKSNASMSALTLLAFLFFLHILQQCIKEHMTEMQNAAPVVVMSSREGNEPLPKTASKMDKAGDISEFEDNTEAQYELKTNPYKTPSINTESDEDKMLRINAAEHKPKLGKVYRQVKNGDSFQSFPSAMNDQ